MNDAAFTLGALDMIGPPVPTQEQRIATSPEVKAAVDTLLGLWDSGSGSSGSHQGMIRHTSSLMPNNPVGGIPSRTSGASDADRLKYAMAILEAGKVAQGAFSSKGLNAWKSATSPLMSSYEPAARLRWQSTSSDGPAYGQWAQYANQLGFNGPIYGEPYETADGGISQGYSPEFVKFVDQARAQGYDFVQDSDNAVNFNQRYGFRLPSGEVVGQTSIRSDQDVRDFGMSLLPIASMMLGVPGIGGSLATSIGSAILPEATAAAIGSAIGASASTVTSAIGQAAIQSGLTALGGGDTEDILRAGALPIAAPVVSGLVGQGLGAISPPDFDPSLGQLAQPMQDAVQKAITAGTLAEIRGGDFTDAALSALATPVAQAVVPSGLGALEKPAESALTSGALAAIRGQDPVDAALTSAAGSTISAAVPRDLGLLERPLEQALATAAGTAIAGGDVETRFRQALSSAMTGATAEQIGKDFGLSAATSRVILDAAMSGGDFNKMFNAMVATSKDLGKPTRVADAGGVDLNDIYADTSPAGIGGAGSAADSAGTLVAGPMDFSAPSKAAEKSQLAEYIRQQAASGAPGFRVGPGGVLEVEDVDRGLVHRFTSDGSALGSSETVFASRSGSPLVTSAAVKDFLAAPYVQSLFEGGAGAGDGAGRYLVPEVTGDGVGSPEAGTSYSPEQAAQWDREAAEEQAANELEQVNPPVILPTDVDTTGDYGQSVFDEIDRSAAEQDPVTQQRLNEMDHQFYMPTQLDFQQPAGLSESQVRQIVAETLAANPSLTAQQVQQIVDSAVQSMPPGLTLQDVFGAVDSAISRLPQAPTAADIDAAIGRATAGMATRADVEQAVRSIQFPEGINQEDVARAISDYMEQNPGLSAQDVALQLEQKLQDLPVYATAADVDAAVKSGLTGYATSQDVSQLGQNLQGQVQSLNQDLQFAISDAIASGLQGDAALRAGLDALAGDLGTTRANLLSQLGTTEQALRADLGAQLTGVQSQVTQLGSELSRAIEAARAEGLQGEEALRAGLNSLAGELGTTKDDLLSRLGTSEQALRSDFASQLGGVQSQVTQLGSSLSDAIAEARASGLQGDAALQKGLDTLAGDLGITKSALLSQIGQTTESLRSQFQADLGGLEAGLTGQIGQLREEAQNQYNAMTAAQQAEVAERVRLGQDLTRAISDVQSVVTGEVEGVKSELTGQIGGLRQEVQEQYEMLSEAQQQEVRNRISQGETLEAAINSVATDIGGRLTSVEDRLNSRIQELLDQDYSFQAATNQALQEVTGSIGALGLDVESQIDEFRRQQDAADAAAAETLRLRDQQQQRDTEAAVARAVQQTAEEAAARDAARAAASAEQSRRATLAGLATSFMGQGASSSGVSDPYKATFLKPYIVGGTAPEKFEGPLSGFLKQAMTGDFLPDKPQDQPRQSEDQQMGADQFFSGSNPLDMYQPEQEYQGLFGFRAGGMVPFMAQGGTRYGHNAHGALRVLEHSGKHRVDYRQGDAVTGIGDGQSDDIPAMLADGEFVIPADVVAALGNGSTKAGSDKLYEMMHNIRRHHRSTGPKDLPPPAKAPLEYIKSRKGRSA